MTDPATLSLFDPPATYRTGEFPGSRNAHTSKAAARSIAAEIGRRHLEVLKALAVLGTASPDEIASRIERHPYVVRPRITELQKRGFITQTGETRTAPTGRQAMVVKITRDGADYLRNMHEHTERYTTANTPQSENQGPVSHD